MAAHFSWGRRDVRWFSIFLVTTTLAAAVAAWAGYRWLNTELVLNTPVVDVSIEPGTTARGAVQAVAEAGVQVDPTLLYWWFRLTGDARKIKAGSYEIEAGATPLALAKKLLRGEEALRSVTLVEGWTFNQVRVALQKAEQLKPETQGLAAEAVMKMLERPGTAAEGRFFPDTYSYAKGSSDLALLRRAARAMDKRVNAAWALRPVDSVLSSPEQLLTLASIVEKETGKAGDRPLVAAVFLNRLRIGMMLQTDPTVIYGMGDKFDGNLRKRDLQTDTPWNTYTRAGLPPTPIAMPGKASLQAVVQPALSKALYFVARGDGSSQFSNSLDEHNRAVNKYLRSP